MHIRNGEDFTEISIRQVVCGLRLKVIEFEASISEFLLNIGFEWMI